MTHLLRKYFKMATLQFPGSFYSYAGHDFSKHFVLYCLADFLQDFLANTCLGIT